MKISFWKKVLHTIINLLKMLFLYIVHFFLSLFPNRNQNKIKKIENKIIETKFKKKNKYFEDSTTALPEDPSEKKIEFKITNEVIEKEIKYIKNALNDNQLYLLSILEEEIDTYLYKKEDIDVKKIDREQEKIIKELKEIIIPPIVEDIRKNIIEYEEELKKEIEKSINTQKKENGFLQTNNLIPENQKQNSDVYSIAIPINKELNLQENAPLQVFQQQSITNINKEQKEDIQKKVEQKETPMMIPINVDKPKLNLKDEISNVLTASSLILANIAKELVITNNEKNNTLPEENISPTIELVSMQKLEESSEVLNTTPLPDIEETEHKTESTPNINDTNIKEEHKTEPIEKPKEKIIAEDTEPESKQVQSTIEETKLTDSNIKPYLETTNLIINSSYIETEKEDLEDKNYEELEERINKMLDKIEEFYLKNEKNLSKEQKILLKNEINKLYNLKENLYNQLESDVKKEEYQLERFIEENETTGLKNKLQEMKLEHQLDLDKMLLNNIEDLNNINQKKVAEIEKKLIKQKLRKASKTLEITSILALPFIRNKYFFYFSIGLFVNNHFNFLNSILKRKTIENNTLDLNKIKRGREALEESININYDNINYLNQLENEILLKHPELSFDNEYLIYINQLKNKLTKNYEKLSKKRDTIDKYCYKNLKQRKILKKKNIPA